MIRLPAKKEASLVTWTVKRPLLPAKVRIPLDQPGFGTSTPLVRAGDLVLTGEKIGRPREARAVSVHASVSGKVTAAGLFPGPAGEPLFSIEISSDGRDARAEGVGSERPGWEALGRDELLGLFRECGLVDLAPKAEPLHLLADGAGHETIVLNACESEPYVTADYALGMSHPLELLKGAELLRRASGASRVVIAFEDNAGELIELLKSKVYFLKWKHFDVRVFPARYPQGAPPVLRAALGLAETVPAFNAASAFAVYEAVVFQKPLFERVVTVAGECVIEPKNMWVRLGTPAADLLKSARGLMREPAKILAGGPMAGLALESLAAPVLKNAQAVLALAPEAVAAAEPAEPCIRCGRCIEACPAELSPAQVTLAVERGLFELVGGETARCLECGNCSYVCPSKRPMLELMRAALRRVRGGDESRDFHAAAEHPAAAEREKAWS